MMKSRRMLSKAMYNADGSFRIWRGKSGMKKSYLRCFGVDIGFGDGVVGKGEFT